MCRSEAERRPTGRALGALSRPDRAPREILDYPFVIAVRNRGCSRTVRHRPSSSFSDALNRFGVATPGYRSVRQ